ncbi:MAG: DUF4381 domain-containing protein [Verrucomicrobia bacterium]|jgi:hypothetical protein|nr:DUF4381 domain-containing protein [Verrucomicrobiota bacterium]
MRDAFALGVFKLTAVCAFATNEPVNPDEIPPLRPAKPEILPGYWEQHGLVPLVAAIVVLALLVLAWRLVSRRRPPTLPAPATVARQSLPLLRGRAEDGALLAEVSAILRRYFIAAFALPDRAFTNGELSGALATHTTVDSRLADAASRLLQDMEQRRFNSEAPGQTADGGSGSEPSPAPVVERALELIDQAEETLRPRPAEPGSAPGIP